MARLNFPCATSLYTVGLVLTLQSIGVSLNQLLSYVIFSVCSTLNCRESMHAWARFSFIAHLSPASSTFCAATTWSSRHNKTNISHCARIDDHCNAGPGSEQFCLLQHWRLWKDSCTRRGNLKPRDWLPIKGYSYGCTKSSSSTEKTRIFYEQTACHLTPSHQRTPTNIGIRLISPETTDRWLYLCGWQYATYASPSI